MYTNFGFYVGPAVPKVSPASNKVAVDNLKDSVSYNASSNEISNVANLDSGGENSTVSITVVGASGDLAKKKIFPALFALYYEGCLPKVCFIG